MVWLDMGFNGNSILLAVLDNEKCRKLKLDFFIQESGFSLEEEDFFPSVIE